MPKFVYSFKTFKTSICSKIFVVWNFYEWISEYIHEAKSGPNEYPNIFGWQKWDEYFRIRIYSEQNIRIYSNIRIFAIHCKGKGKTRTDIVASTLHFKEVVNSQNRYHPHTKNELVVATILNPPKFVWFPDNGPAPPNHKNMLSDIKELNSWITYFNQQNGKITPRFHRFGVKNGWRLDKNRKRVHVQCHQFQQWRQSEPVHDMLHLSDQWRVRLGISVTRHFQGEQDRNGILG